MSASSASSVIQQKFLKLFQDIGLFFEGERQLQDKDSTQLTLSRTSMMELTKEVTNPSFDRFLAFLMGATELRADYPLQAIRMACLTAKGLQGEKLSAEQRQELLTVALVADTGFRPAWLGHHGLHYEITSYQLKSLGLPWYSPSMERLILNHHNVAEDSSPFKILSLLSSYLGKVYGTGVEDVGMALLSPAAGVRHVMTDLQPDSTQLRVFMKAVGALPIGSWVQLSNGKPALVVGSNVKHILKPVVAHFKAGAGKEVLWEDTDLEKSPKLHITKDIEASTEQRQVLNHPELLVPGWLAPPEESEDAVTLPATDKVNVIHHTDHEASPLPAALKTPDDYRRHLGGGSRPEESASRTSSHQSTGPSQGPSAGPSQGPTGHGPASWPGSETEPGLPSKLHLLKFYREELINLRNTWEQQVRAAEQVTTSLKSPLLESYRRENELMASMLDRIQALETHISAGVETTADEEAPESAAEDAPADEDVSTETDTETSEGEDSAEDTPAASPEPVHVAEEAGVLQLSEDHTIGLEQVHNHLESFQDQVETDQGRLRQLKERFHDTIQHLEGGQLKTLPSLLAFARDWQAKLESAEQSLNRSEDEALALTAEWNTLRATTTALSKGSRKMLLASWKDQIKPRMEKVLQAAQKALSSHHRRLLSQADMIERFCTEAYHLTR